MMRNTKLGDILKKTILMTVFNILVHQYSLASLDRSRRPTDETNIRQRIILTHSSLYRLYKSASLCGFFGLSRWIECIRRSYRLSSSLSKFNKLVCCTLALRSE